MAKSASKRFWLKQIGFDRRIQETLILRVLLVRNRVITGDGDSTIEVVEGRSYGHSVELARNYALWPITAYVHSSVSSDQVLSFTHGEHQWDFMVEVLPNHGTDERRELLSCNAALVDRAEIRTAILLGTGESDSVTLELKVKAR